MSISPFDRLLLPNPELTRPQVPLHLRRAVRQNHEVRDSLAAQRTVDQEGKYALHWTRLSCHRFVANQVRLALFVLAYNLGNFLQRLALPESIHHWSLRSIQVKLIKIGAKVIQHA